MSLTDKLRAALTALAVVYAFGLFAYLILRWLLGDRLWWLALINTFALYYFLPLVFILPLVVINQQWQALTTLLPLLVVGLTWFGPYALPQTIERPSGAALTAASFNVWGGNSHFDLINAWLRESDADLILLQEVPPEYVQAMPPDILALYPARFHPGADAGNHGIVVLSRHPIVATETGSYAHRLVLDIDGQEAAVYAVHLTYPGTGPARIDVSNIALRVAASYDNRPSNSQIAELLERLDREPLPYIVAGDFNTSAYTPTYRLMAKTMQDAYHEAGNGLGHTWPADRAIVNWVPGFVPPLLRIDYIWHSAHFRAVGARNGPPGLGSDHLPVIAELVLTAPAD